MKQLKLLIPIMLIFVMSIGMFSCNKSKNQKDKKMETKIQMVKTETSPAIAVAFWESEENTKRPIIFGHGAAMGSWDFEEYFMPYFFKKGYNVYALNWRGYGESDLAEGQDYHAVTLDDCVQDLRNVVEMVKERTGKDPIIAGHSQGGAVTQMYMKEYEVETAILIGMADFAYLMPPVIEFFIARFPEGKKRVDAGDFGWFSDDKAFVKAFMFGDETEPKMKMWAEMMAKQGAAAATVNDVMTIYKVGEAIGKPKVFIVTGSVDPAAISESVESGVKAYNADNLLIEGMYHGVPTSKDWKLAADGIINWLEK